MAMSDETLSDEKMGVTGEAPVVPAPEVAPETGSPETGSIVPSLDIGSQSGVVATTDAVEPVVVQHVVRGRLLENGTIVATGRRKTAVARVRIKRGTGKFVVNGREMTEFFPVEKLQLLVQLPLNLTSMRNEVDVWVRADGGGISGQAGAILLGISRALHCMKPELHPILAEHSLLTRDDRMVERKKYGHKKARRSFQFSKR
jgi:small subunit ribosomal protein S9